MKLLSRIILWISGWKVIGEIPEGLKKFVMVAAPHTSNWDLLYARAAFYLMDIPLKYTVKKELFFFPLGNILGGLGGIPINRKSKENMVDKMVALYKEREELCILVTPEATRSYSAEWKKGFYFIAEGADIPIVLGYLDYKKKHAGIGPMLKPSGNYQKDLAQIQNFYRDITPKHPQKGVK